jgi:hypothetical protein
MLLDKDGIQTQADLTQKDYNVSGDITNANAEVNLVVGAASKAEQFIQNKQYSLLWRDSDLLFQSPRPMSVFENTYILEPNVQRFTVAKVVNAIVPQLYKGLFYTDPPMVLRPRPGTSQDVIDAKTAMAATLLDECDFKMETKMGLEQMAHLGTGIWKWGIKYKKIVTKKRKPTVSKVDAGPDGYKSTVMIPTEDPPNIEVSERYAPRPYIESRPIDRVLVDPHTSCGDIRRADFAIDMRWMDFYQLQEWIKGINELPNEHPDKKGWVLPSPKELLDWFMPPSDAGAMSPSVTQQAAYIKGVVHHAEDINVQVTPDLLMRKLEVLEYWDKKRKIVVINRKHKFYSGDNQFGVLPFLSANWWSRPRAFYGMGLGLIVGQNQRVDQGTINAILKMLSFGVNPIYLRKRDSNSPTQMIRTGLGKILTVDGDVKDAYGLLDTPKVPSDVWSALAESEKATESSSGADAQLVQGSSSGPRSSMGRTATGATNLAGASATRLDGPLDNFIEQVFKPWLYILDMLVFEYFSDAEIYKILGEEKGKDFEMDFGAFHEGGVEYEVLAGASLAAKRTMAQSMTLIEQIFTNPSIQQNLADINEEYIDIKEILKMWMEASEWKNFNDIVKPMTDQMKQKQQAKSQAAQQQSKQATQSAISSQNAEQKAKLQADAIQGRIQERLIVGAVLNSAKGEANEGAPSDVGIGGGPEDQSPL